MLSIHGNTICKHISIRPAVNLLALFDRNFPRFILVHFTNITTIYLAFSGETWGAGMHF